MQKLVNKTYYNLIWDKFWTFYEKKNPKKFKRTTPGI